MHIFQLVSVHKNIKLKKLSLGTTLKTGRYRKAKRVGKINRINHNIMKNKLLVIFSVMLFIISSCDKAEVTSNDDHKEVTSPYYGWFKDKNEFSFTAVSNSSGMSYGMLIEGKVTSYYYVKNTKEAVREITETKIDGVQQPTTEKIYITSANGNYVINPIAKVYYKEAGNYDAVMFSKVWVWTRKRSDSYDALLTNSSAIKTTETLNSVSVECFAISGVKFYFDSDKKLLKYTGSASGIATEIVLTDYKEGNVPNFIEESINKIDKEGYSLSDSQFGF